MCNVQRTLPQLTTFQYAAMYSGRLGSRGSETSVKKKIRRGGRGEWPRHSVGG